MASETFFTAGSPYGIKVQMNDEPEDNLAHLGVRARPFPAKDGMTEMTIVSTPGSLDTASTREILADIGRAFAETSQSFAQSIAEQGRKILKEIEAFDVTVSKYMPHEREMLQEVARLNGMPFAQVCGLYDPIRPRDGSASEIAAKAEDFNNKLRPYQQEALDLIQKETRFMMQMPSRIYRFPNETAAQITPAEHVFSMRDLNKRFRARTARHIASGEIAYVRKLSRGLCLAQFNRFDHPHSHHWHLYLRRDFKRI